MSDIVERLRNTLTGSDGARQTLNDAAAEIERLREHRGHMRAVVECAGFGSVTEALVEIDRLRAELLTVLSREAETTKRYDAKLDALEARLAEAVEAGDTLRAAIAYALSNYTDDGLIFLSEWSEGNPDAMAELDKWRLAKLEGRA